MPQLSLQKALLLVIAPAIGFAIYRLPGGSWTDPALAAASCLFVFSLGRHAATIRRRLRDQRYLPRDLRWGWRIEMVVLLVTAAALVVGIAASALAAAQIWLVPSDGIDYLEVQQLPRQLQLLGLLAALGVSPRRTFAMRPVALRQRVYAVVATVGTLAVIVAYWCGSTATSIDACPTKVHALNPH